MNDALQVYALCVVLLFLKMLAISCYQGYLRLSVLAFHNPEDAAFFKRRAREAERPQVIRAARAWTNDLENIPAFFVLGGLALALDAPATFSAWLCVVFTLARVLHTLTYLAGVQPWRTTCYAAALVCLLGFCVVIATQLAMG